ncbi:MAG: hypothetical protein OEY93_02180 [Anaerolineae bacterium]|nr:hypothetical protein [Anaerolineae bacterium]
MPKLPIDPLYIKVLRWSARALSLLPIIFAAGEILFPHSETSINVPLAEWVVAGLSFLAVIGLVLAWRWEGFGGAVAITGVVVFYLAYRMVRGEYFPAFGLVPLSMVLIPGALFMICWYCDQPLLSGNSTA